MAEHTLTIDLDNPVDFYGSNDSNLTLLRNKFPALKIIARGNELRILGEDALAEACIKEIEGWLKLYQQTGSVVLEPNDGDWVGDDAKAGTAKQMTNGSHVLVYGPNGLVVKARTANQMRMVESNEVNDIVFAIGPAGTGKTYTAVALAVRALKNKEIRRIVLCRPAVEAGENLGFLPGDLKEKIDPYLRPLYDALFDMIPGEKLKSMIENGIIEVAPLAFMRGRTLDNAFVILDEAQNATQSQLKMFLTRMGPSAKFIVTGDTTQIDLPRNQPSGLVQALQLLQGIKGIDVIYLNEQDVVRHRLVKQIIMAYGKTNNEK
ncbi:MAG: PhoH family protein [Bacteroidetes bacterium]|nr:PhoH family protein [Bacteroidota bacterium]